MKNEYYNPHRIVMVTVDQFQDEFSSAVELANGERREATGRTALQALRTATDGCEFDITKLIFPNWKNAPFRSLI